jgi:hypothetical protein
MFGEKPMAVRVERIEMGVAQIRADLQRIDRKVETQVEAIRQELSDLMRAIEEMTAGRRT